jgi:hypothetical protein
MRRHCDIVRIRTSKTDGLKSTYNCTYYDASFYLDSREEEEEEIVVEDKEEIGGRKMKPTSSYY